MKKLLSDDVVRTGSGGLHVYCNTEFFNANNNRMIKCYSCGDFDIDLMASVDEMKRSLIVLSKSQVRKNHKSTINTYEVIRGGWDSTITRSISEVLNDLDIKLLSNKRVKRLITSFMKMSAL